MSRLLLLPIERSNVTQNISQETVVLQTMPFLDRIKLKLVQFDLIPDAWIRYRLGRDLQRWQRERVGPVPHLLKQRVVLEYAALSRARVFVETGTYYGDMLQACLDHFDQLISLEIEKHFYQRAWRRLQRDPKVTLLHGDSGKLLPEVLRRIDRPCVFWLDAHYSCGLTGKAELETPICSELEAILSHPVRHTILIDDANAFDGTHDYPTLAWIENTARRTGYSMSLSQNIIRLVTSHGLAQRDLPDSPEGSELVVDRFVI